MNDQEDEQLNEQFINMLRAAGFPGKPEASTMTELTPRPWPKPVQRSTLAQYVAHDAGWYIGDVARFDTEADAILAWQAVNAAAWQCSDCGCTFLHICQANALMMEGVTRCSRCVEVEVIAGQRDELLAKVEALQKLCSPISRLASISPTVRALEAKVKALRKALEACVEFYVGSDEGPTAEMVHAALALARGT